MKVLVDTSVWSLALRRKEPSEITSKLSELILSSLIVMIGPIRQELLSGISNEDTFLELKTKLKASFCSLLIKLSQLITIAYFFKKSLL